MFLKCALVIGAALVAIPIAVKADTININYYTISSSDPDANEL